MTLRRSPIRHQSKKGAARHRLWSKITADRRSAKGDICEINSPVCVGHPIHGHHKLNRSQGGRDTAENCLLACDFCNTYLEDFPAWAVEHGFKIQRKGMA